MQRIMAVLAFYVLGFLLSCSLHAQTLSQVYGDSLTRQAQTLYITGTAGLIAFDSEAAGSKETRTTTDFELGGWMGEDRIVALRIQHSSNHVSFELNKAKLREALTDVRLQGRIWFLQPSLGISLSELDVSNEVEPVVGLFANGINAGLGLIINMYTGLVFSADALGVKSTRTFDKLGKGTELGDRQDLDTHFAFDLTDNVVDFLVGYKARRYTLKVDVEESRETFKETSQGAYVGIRLGIYF